MINFHRSALTLSLAALFASASYAHAADVPLVMVTLTD